MSYMMGFRDTDTVSRIHNGFQGYVKRSQRYMLGLRNIYIKGFRDTYVESLLLTF